MAHDDTARFEGARRERLADILYGQLMRDIASGVYQEGDRLPTEKELTIQFDVSRPVVREALMRLQADGLVVARQGAGTFVKRRPPTRIVELAPPAQLAGILRAYEVRIALEGQAARLAAQRRTEPDLARIRQRLEDMREGLNTGAAARTFDFGFHLAIAQASGNTLFVDMLESIETQVLGGMGVALALTGEAPPERWITVLGEHERIFEAITQGDADSAEITMRFHIDQAKRRVTDRTR